MSFLSEIKERAVDFIHSSSRLRLAVISVLSFLFISAFITAAIASLSIPREKKEGISSGGPFIPQDDFFLPPEKPLTENYYFSREEKAFWDESESSRWFTVPDRSFIESLSETNSSRINDILGAAP
ncbi:MAG: hypothetical protein J5780_01975 [Treponema sp.]|nr:hypothetical protein [Treponema sp.]